MTKSLMEVMDWEGRGSRIRQRMEDGGWRIIVVRVRVRVGVGVGAGVIVGDGGRSGKRGGREGSEGQ
jgi:hypothetical protein